jgi:putative acyl-CoA dehydrogenase
VSTHEVLNQPPPLVHNAFTDDTALQEALAAFGGDPHDAGLIELGALAGSERAREWGRLANEYTPVLRTHDRYGHRVDEVEFHPAWHELMTVAVANGLHAAPWTADDKAAHVRRAAGFIVWSQAEAGHGCPISMTYASIPALRVDPARAAQWEAGLASGEYDFGLRTPSDKRGLIAGMAMTEKQGGSDVRTNTTVAVPTDDGYLLTGHKWFCSAPMSDVFLVLAQAPGGLTCFIVPRVLPDGSRNVFEIQRLKDKLGNRSNASSEIEFDGTWAQRLGDEGRGVRTIVEMVSATRSGHGPGLNGADAQGAVRGNVAHLPPGGVRRHPDRPAADATGSRGHGPGGRGGHLAGHASGPRGRRLRSRVQRAGGLPADRPAHVQVLRVQARTRAHVRGDGDASVVSGTSRRPDCRGCTGRPP